MGTNQNQIRSSKYILIIVSFAFLFSLLAVIFSLMMILNISKSQNIVVGSLETFTNSEVGFTFEYPEELVADQYSLWKVDRHQRFLNPPDGCSICNIPDVEIRNEKSELSLERFILNDAGFGDLDSLEEVRGITGEYHFELDLGGNSFIKLKTSDLFEVTTYYTKHDDQIVWFRVYSVNQNVNETDELALMISSLRFD